jgi:hypothetical protein
MGSKLRSEDVIEVFKVVSVYFGNYYSVRGAVFLFSTYLEDICCEYVIGQTTHPLIPESALFAFARRKNAEMWRNNLQPLIPYSAFEILKCTAQVHRLNGAIKGIPVLRRSSEETISLFWESEKDRDPILSHGQWDLPQGSVLCDWITPLKLVF